MSRVAASLVIVSALIGALPVTAQDSEPKELVVIDLRPAEEKEGSALAELSGKCNKSVYRVADVATDPLKLELLKNDLAQVLGTEGKTLTVLNWSIYYNKQIQKSGGGLSSVGIGGYNIPGKKEEKKAGSSCTRRDSAGGWYQANELDGSYFPLISEFEGTFAGKAVHARVVYSPQKKLAGKFAGDPADTDALLEAVHKTSEAVATAIAQ
jgi:hypothetical protein